MRNRESCCPTIVLDNAQPGGYTTVAVNGVGDSSGRRTGAGSTCR
jgi:hypothetical protein